MDQDGLFLILSMCNVCRTSKGSWKKCMSKRHNPRLLTVHKEKLTFAHRQCVKPDQTMTIYKLRNHETNEEFLEFSDEIVFQTPCPRCTGIKGCINLGHRLVDWQPVFTDKESPPHGNIVEDDEALGAVSTPSPSKGSSTTPTAGGGSGGNSAAGANASTGGRGRKGAFSPSGATAAGAFPATAPASTGRGGRRSGGAGKGKIGKGVGAGKAGGGGKGSAPSGGPDEAGGGMMDEADAISSKGSHKRKSPGPVASPPAKNSKISTPRSAPPSSQVAEEPGSLKRPGQEAEAAAAVVTAAAAAAAAVAAASGSAAASSGSAADDHALDGDASSQDMSLVGDGGEEGIAAESAVGEVDGDGGDIKFGTDSKELSIQEQLEAVKQEEAELLKQFEHTHHQCARDEEVKREEMAAFQAAGEAAILEMRRKKEESLHWISEQRKKIAFERETLVRQRIKELEAEQAQARKEAQEREARLQAEKEALSKAVSSDGGVRPANGDSWLSSAWAAASSNAARSSYPGAGASNSSHSSTASTGVTNGAATGAGAGAGAGAGQSAVVTNGTDSSSSVLTGSGGPGLSGVKKEVNGVVGLGGGKSKPQEQQEGKDRNGNAGMVKTSSSLPALGVNECVVPLKDDASDKGLKSGRAGGDAKSNGGSGRTNGMVAAATRAVTNSSSVTAR